LGEFQRQFHALEETVLSKISIEIEKLPSIDLIIHNQHDHYDFGIMAPIQKPKRENEQFLCAAWC